MAVTLYLEAVLPPTVPPSAAAPLLAGRPLLGTLFVFVLVGFVIVRRQERNAVGWILFGAAVSFAVPQVAIVYVTSAEYSPAGAYPIPGVVGMVGNAGF
ncbi:MAG TPA: hypothetical protein VGS17_11420, partial [Candidatus Limnocylindria bacterium]|nr:hypothetical protein [Candidatus Limnocylindria bacterium]